VTWWCWVGGQMIGKTASRCFEEDGEAVWRKQETKLCGAVRKEALLDRVGQC
jgi:hypothetical protein